MDLLTLLKTAINCKKPICFKYSKEDKNNDERIGNAHAIYYSSDGTINVDIFQTNGASDSISENPLPSWRQFELDFIKDVKILDNKPDFNIADGYNQNSKKYSNDIYRIIR